MNLDTQNIIWRHLQVKARAWTMSFGTKQSWSSSCMMFMLQMKRVMTLKPGLSIVKAKDYRIYSEFLTPYIYFFIKFSRNHR